MARYSGSGGKCFECGKNAEIIHKKKLYCNDCYEVIILKRNPSKKPFKYLFNCAFCGIQMGAYRSDKTFCSPKCNEKFNKELEAVNKKNRYGLKPLDEFEG